MLLHPSFALAFHEPIQPFTYIQDNIGFQSICTTANTHHTYKYDLYRGQWLWWEGCCVWILVCVYLHSTMVLFHPAVADGYLYRMFTTIWQQQCELAQGIMCRCIAINQERFSNSEPNAECLGNRRYNCGGNWFPWGQFVHISLMTINWLIFNVR